MGDDHRLNAIRRGVTRAVERVASAVPTVRGRLSALVVIALVPALVILVALTLFYLVELLVYVPLKLFGRKARAPQAPTAKDVNAPELELKLA